MQQESRVQEGGLKKVKYDGTTGGSYVFPSEAVATCTLGNQNDLQLIEHSGLRG